MAPRCVLHQEAPTLGTPELLPFGGRFSYYTLSRTIIYRVRSVVSGFLGAIAAKWTAVFFFCSRDPRCALPRSDTFPQRPLKWWCLGWWTENRRVCKLSVHRSQWQTQLQKGRWNKTQSHFLARLAYATHFKKLSRVCPTYVQKPTSQQIANNREDWRYKLMHTWLRFAKHF